MTETIEKLFKRSEAAIVEAKRLVEISLLLQARINDDIKRMSFRDFRPNDRKIRYPQDAKDRG